MEKDLCMRKHAGREGWVLRAQGWLFSAEQKNSVVSIVSGSAMQQKK